MKYIRVGKIVNTHALKGEVRIISDFEYKERIFIPNKSLYIGQFKICETIETHRLHKQYDLVKFKGIDYINDVLKYKGEVVYINEEDLTLQDNEIIESDFINYEFYNKEECIGKIEEYRCDNGNKMIRLNGKFIPYNKDFIGKIDKEKKIIYMHDIEVFL